MNIIYIQFLKVIFKFESFELSNWMTKEPLEGNTIEINRGEAISIIGKISKEEQEKLGLRTNLAESYWQFLKSEDEFFNGVYEEQYMFNIQIPGEYKISAIYVIGNPQYYVIKEYTLIVK